MFFFRARDDSRPDPATRFAPPRDAFRQPHAMKNCQCQPTRFATKSDRFRQEKPCVLP